MGGGTTKIGDPSGKDESRKLLTHELIKSNIASIRRVFEHFLTFGDGPTDAIMVDNDDWLSQLDYIPFLRDIGPHFTINRMLTFDSVQLRLEREQPLTFLEFNYMILQAYDFLELSRRVACRLQLGGSDQWGNIVNGVELCRRVDGTQVYGLTTPLITTADGGKMGKTEKGAVWLNPDQLAPYDYWQFWRNAQDGDVGRFLRLFTDLPLDEIARLEALEGAEINDAKKILADAATSMAHGDDAAVEAAETARKTFEEGAAGEALPTLKVEGSIGLVDALVGLGLVGSKNEARRLIAQGGARIDGRGDGRGRPDRRDLRRPHLGRQEEARPADALAMGVPIHLIGLPTDVHSSYLRGPARAPAANPRAAGQRAWQCRQRTGQRDRRWRSELVDRGDLPHDRGTRRRSDHHRRRDRGAARRRDPDRAGRRPFGELPRCSSAIAAAHGPVDILHFDAHPDLYDDYGGDPRSHASPFARIMEDGLARRLVQVGIRTLNRHCRAQAERFGVEIIEARHFRPGCVPKFEGPLYISIDMDGFDPSCAPGVSHLEPGGLTARDVTDVLLSIETPIAGADVVELNPDRDINGMTAILAAKMVKELAALATDYPAIPPRDGDEQVGSAPHCQARSGGPGDLLMDQP